MLSHHYPIFTHTHCWLPFSSLLGTSGSISSQTGKAPTRPVRGLTLADAGVAGAQAAPLFAVPVKPDAEHHEDQPAGGANARNEGWLLDHV